MNEQVNPEVMDIAKQRLAKWRGAVEQELQSLVQQASEIRRNIDTAKTNVKKQYYAKKFKKVTNEVLQMVATMQRLDAQGAELEKETTRDTSNDQFAPA
jgi:hypothetical protein